MTEHTFIEVERPRQLDADALAVLDFKIRHDIPLTTGEASALFGEDPATTTRKRAAGGDQPPFVRFGRKVRYLPSHVLEWMRKRPAYSNTSAADNERSAAQAT